MPHWRDQSFSISAWQISHAETEVQQQNSPDKNNVENKILEICTKETHKTS